MSVGLQIFIGLVVLLVGAFVTFIFKRFYNEWREENRKRQINYMKIEAIVAGLKKMNGKTSESFTALYDAKLKELTAEYDLITK